MPKNEAIAAAVAEAKEERALVKTTESTNAALALPTSMDWKKWELPMTAALLAQIPMPSRDGDKYLSPQQAAIWAIVSYEQGLSPFTGETWFNPQNNKVNLTLQGKLTRARNLGMKLGAPTFERIPADATKPCIAYKCILPTSNGKVEYTATLAEWLMPTNPNWKNRPEHMLQVRAYEKAVSFAAGVGASEDPGDRDIEDTNRQPLPTIEATPVEIIHAEVPDDAA